MKDSVSDTGFQSFPSAHRASVAAGFVTGMLAGWRAQGGEPAALLRAVGVDAKVLEDARERVAIDRYAALYNAVVAQLGDEAFGLLSQPMRPGSFEFLCRGVVASATLGEALDRAARFLAIVAPDLPVAIHRGADAAWIEISERPGTWPRREDPRRVFAYEWLLRLLHGLACWLAARGLALDHVRFPFPRPAHAADYALVYAERTAFDADTLAARFDAALLDLPVRRDASDLAAFLEGAPGKISMLYRRDRAMVRAVREMLEADLAAAPTLAEAARRLHLSTRTLHRRLAEEGSSFREIKDRVRRELALERLARRGQSVAETALELGYSEPSAFFRAFQGWTGEAPSAYRRRHRGDKITPPPASRRQVP